MAQNQQLSFPIRSFQELNSVLYALNIPLESGDSNTPSVKSVMRIFQTFYENLGLPTPELVLEQTREIYSDTFSDSFTPLQEDALQRIVMFFLYRMLFEACAVPNFFLTDVRAPSRERLQHQLSALFNAIEFQESLKSHALQAQDQRMEVQQSVQEHRAAISAASEGIAKLTADMQHQSAELDALSMEYGALNARVQDLQREAEAANAYCGELEASVERQSQHLQGLLDDIKRQEERVVDPEAPELLQRQKDSSSKQNEQMRQELDVLTANLVSLERNIAVASQFREALQALQAVVSEFKQHRKELYTATCSKADDEKALTTGEARIEELRRKAGELQGELDKVTATLQGDIVSQEGHLDDFRRKYEEAVQQRERLRQVYSQKAAEKRHKEEEVASLDRQRARERAEYELYVGGLIGSTNTLLQAVVAEAQEVMSFSSAWQALAEDQGDEEAAEERENT